MNKKTIMCSFLWQYGERLSVQGISFIVTIILARILLPEEYGIISIATIFITLLEVFVTSGWGSALVQKKDVTSVDFSSVFYFNILFSTLLFLGIAFCSSLISELYNIPQLALVLQLMSFRIVITSFNSIQVAYVQRNFLFKRLFYSSLCGTFVSANLGIWAAYSGYGVFALVIQYLSNAIVSSLVLFVIIKWRPTLEFSWERLKVLITYGGKLLGSGLLNTAFVELKGFVIGSRYTSADLAYYDRGRQFPSLVYDNLNTSIGKVLFPLMSQAQNDRQRVLNMTRLSLQLLSSILLPILFILFAIASPLIEYLLTEKWLPSVSFLQVTCVTYSFVIPNTVFTNAINAIGRSDLHLKVEMLNIVSGVIILFALINWGSFYIALSVTLSNIICMIVRFIICQRLFNLSLIEFASDFLLSYMLSVVSLIPMLLVERFIQRSVLLLVILPIIGLIVYMLMTFYLNKDVVIQMKRILKSIYHV